MRHLWIAVLFSLKSATKQGRYIDDTANGTQPKTGVTPETAKDPTSHYLVESRARRLSNPQRKLMDIITQPLGCVDAARPFPSHARARLTARSCSALPWLTAEELAREIQCRSAHYDNVEA